MTGRDDDLATPPVRYLMIVTIGIELTFPGNTQLRFERTGWIVNSRMDHF